VADAFSSVPCSSARPAGRHQAAGKVLDGSEVVLDAWVVDHHQLE